MDAYPEERLTAERAAWRVIRELFAGIGWGLLGFSLTPLAVCPPFINGLLTSALGEVSPAHDLLTGYLRSYWGVVLMFGVGALLQLRMIVITVLHFFRRRPEEKALERQLENEYLSLTYLSGPGPDRRRQELKKVLEQYNAATVGRFMGCFMNIALAGAVLFFYYIVLFEGGATSVPIDPQVHIPAVQAELEQLERGDLESAVVWIHPKASTAHLPGPWGGSYQSPVRNYHIISFDTGGQWVEIYVPETLGFSLNLERPYRGSQSIDWNLEHAQRYEVFYTSNYHLVEKIIPVP